MILLIKLDAQLNDLEPNINPEGGKRFPLENIPPRIFIVITLFTVFFTYQILGGILTAAFFGLDDISTGSDITGMRILTSFSQFMFILFPVLLLSYLQGNNYKDTFKIKSPNLAILLLSIAGILLIQPSIEAYLYFQDKLLYSLPLGDDFTQALRDLDDLFKELTMKLVVSHSIPELMGVLIVIAVTPAICEEFFFRGLILKNFERSFRPAQAVLYTAILFAIFHFHPLNLIPLAAMGYFLTYIVHYSGSIYTGIICHFINNSFAVIAVYFLGAESLDQTTISDGNDISVLLYGLGSLILFIFVLRMIKKISVLQKKSGNSNAPQSDE